MLLYLRPLTDSLHSFVTLLSAIVDNEEQAKRTTVKSRRRFESAKLRHVVKPESAQTSNRDRMKRNRRGGEGGPPRIEKRMLQSSKNAAAQSGQNVVSATTKQDPRFRCCLALWEVPRVLSFCTRLGI